MNDETTAALSESPSWPQGRTTRQQAAIARLQIAGDIVEASNLDPADPESLLTRVAMEAGEQRSMWDVTASAPFLCDVCYMSVRQAEQFNRTTGEVEGKLRTTIVGPSGQILTTNSPVVARAALAILSHPNANRKFVPPLECEIRRAATMSGGHALTAHFGGPSLVAALADKG